MTGRSRKWTFENGAGDTLAANLELPPGDEPLAWALFAHCFTCSKDGAAAARISRGLRARGFGVLRFDFTGLGSSEGDFANTGFSSNVADLVAAADRLREEFAAPRLLVGHSLGGAAVLAAAERIPETRLVATIAAPSEPAHVRRLLGGDAERIEREGEAEVELAGRRFPIRRQFLEDLDRTRLLDRLPELDAALLVFHAPLDEVVGIDHAQAIFTAAKHPKSFVSLHGADHLLSRPADADHVAGVIAAVAPRHLGAEPDAGAAPEEPPLPDGIIEVAESGLGAYAQRVRAGRHESVADEPEEVGGDDLGPDPYDLLLSALGACTAMTLRMYAGRKDWPLEHVAVRLRHDRIHAEDCEQCEAKTGKVDRIDIELRVAGDLSAEQRERLVEIAHRCPVHRTLVSDKQLSVRLAD